MPRFVARSSMPVGAPELRAWHEAPGAPLRLSPPWRRWPLERSPVTRRRHLHRCLADGGHSILEDEVDYALPAGALGALLAGRAARRSLEREFRFRHRRTRDDLSRHRRYADAPRLRVAITGATGLVGTTLEAYLLGAGHRVCRVTRAPRPGSGDVGWSPAQGELDAAALEGVDAVVHLAGAGIFALRWTEAKKREIRDSRVAGTELLARGLAGLARRPAVLISSSATGLYGDRGDESLTEASAPGQGFLAEVCRDWEGAAAPAAKAGIRVVALRTGVVLSARGGALARMLPPFRAGLGGRVGSGRQHLSWISLDDLVGAIEFLLHGDLSGAVNATSPQPVDNAELTRTLGRVLRRPSAIPLPAPVLRRLLGEFAEEMLLASTRALPSALGQAGFEFTCPDLEQALRLELGALRDAGGAFEHRS